MGTTTARQARYKKPLFVRIFIFRDYFTEFKNFVDDVVLSIQGIQDFPDYDCIEECWVNMKAVLIDLVSKCETLQEAVYTHFERHNY